MPKDNSIKSVLIIGSGPIIIGQACEFDYSGTQAATKLAGRRYQSDPDQQQSCHHHDRPDDGRQSLSACHLPLKALNRFWKKIKLMQCCLPWADKLRLNLAKEAEELGIWEKYNVRLIGVDIKAIDKAEDREKFRQWMIQIGSSRCSSKNCQLISRRKRICTGDRISVGDSPFFYTGRNRRRLCA